MKITKIIIALAISGYGLQGLLTGHNTPYYWVPTAFGVFMLLFGLGGSSSIQSSSSMDFSDSGGTDGGGD